MTLTQITEKGIKDGEIINADINASAAIDVSKLSGVLPLAGGTLTGDLTISNTAPSIALIDTDSNSDFSIFGSQGEFRIRDQTNTTNRLVINSSGNVGIGTSSPGYKLEVVDASVLLKLNSSNEGNYDVRFVYQNSEANIWSYSSSDLTFGTRFARKLHLVTNGPQKRVTIDDGGRVGIGTTSPQVRLDATGTGVIGRFKSTNNNYVLSLLGNNASQQSFIGTTSSGDMVFATGSGVSERVRIREGGGLTFNGDTAAANALHDYEEGNCPNLAFRASNASGDSNTSVQESKYIKIGGMVHFSFYIDMNAHHASGTGGMVKIVGLPFQNTGNHVAISVGYFNHFIQNQNFVSGTVQPSTSEILLRHTTGNATGTSNMDYSNAIGTSTEIIISGCYGTAS